MDYISYELPKVQIGDMTFERMQMEHHILQQRRKELKLTQQQVADKARIQLRQYQRLESGEQSLGGTSGRILLSVCRVLRLSPEFMLGLETIQNVPEEHSRKCLVLPPVDDNGIFYEIPQYAYFLLVCEIPCGRIATYDSIKECLRKAYNLPNGEIKNDWNSYQLHEAKAFPYWRVISERGHLLEMTYTYKEKQQELLGKENVRVKKREDMDCYEVVDYKKYLFSFDNLNITVMDPPKKFAEKAEQYTRMRENSLKD